LGGSCESQFIDWSPELGGASGETGPIIALIGFFNSSKEMGGQKGRSDKNLISLSFRDGAVYIGDATDAVYLFNYSHSVPVPIGVEVILRQAYFLRIYRRG
jgi:hypothetical protein